MIMSAPLTVRFDERCVKRYIRKGQVDGWLDKFSAESIAVLSKYQVDRERTGSVVEIGVHHGKLFFVLYLTTTVDEAAIAIDVFDAQHLNIDQSGRGDKATFLRHARRLSPELAGLKIIEDSSLNLTSDQIHTGASPVRLFSIDGAHTEEATMNDLWLADASLADYGVVILDDVFNERWPEVSVGLSRYISNERHQLTPFAITPGKVLLAKADYAAEYADHLVASFPHRTDKRARLYGYSLPILGVTQWTLKRRIGRTPVGSVAKRFLRRSN
jgi:hypothetical protein